MIDTSQSNDRYVSIQLDIGYARKQLELVFEIGMTIENG